MNQRGIKRSWALSGLIVVCAIVWVFSPSVHRVEVINSSGAPIVELKIRLGDGERNFGAIPEGGDAKAIFFRVPRSPPTNVRVHTKVGSGEAVEAHCGYISFMSSKTVVTLRGPSFQEQRDCEFRARPFGWIP